MPSLLLRSRHLPRSYSSDAVVCRIAVLATVLCCRAALRWATELYQRKLYMRAMRHYKKAMLDLEVPCEFYEEAHVVERNQLRCQLHLNTALCALKVSPHRSYPNLSTPKMHWDPHHDAIHHW